MICSSSNLQQRPWLSSAHGSLDQNDSALSCGRGSAFFVPRCPAFSIAEKKRGGGSLEVRDVVVQHCQDWVSFGREEAVHDTPLVPHLVHLVIVIEELYFHLFSS